MRQYLFVIAIFIGQCCTLQAQEIRNVLFLGNSYTQVNDLPKMLHDVAKAMGDSVAYDSNTPGGYTFQGHSTDVTSIAKIQSRHWDYVVLQEQSQLPSFPPSQVLTDVFPYAHKLDSIINSNYSCTETVFYMTWGRKNGDASNCASWPAVCTYEGMQEQLRKNYLQMGIDNSATVAPVGMAWYKTRLQSPSFDLWSGDESHPSIYGTYLTACVFYATLFHKSPQGCTFISTLNAPDAGFLQQMATQTVFDSLDKWASAGDKAYARFSTLVNGLNVQFIDSSLNANSRYWDFDDGNSSTLTQPSHTFASQGVYNIKLVAGNGCFDDTSNVILNLNVSNIQSQDRLLKGFSISPNPVSQYLVLSNLQEKEIEYLEIMDAVGMLLYKNNSPSASSVKIDLSSLSAGYYLLHVHTTEGALFLPFIKAE